MGINGYFVYTYIAILPSNIALYIPVAIFLALYLWLIGYLAIKAWRYNREKPPSPYIVSCNTRGSARGWVVRVIPPEVGDPYQC